MTTIKRKLKSVRLLLGVATAGLLLLAMASATPALAGVECNSCTPWWQISFQSSPANLPPGGEGEISVLAEDFGDALPSTSSSVVLTDKLPAGLTAQSVVALLTTGTPEAEAKSLAASFCKVLPGEVVSTMPGEEAEFYFPRPYSYLEARIKVNVTKGAESGEENQASITGGGAPGGSASSPITVSSASTRFGIEHYALRAEGADGSPDTQAGSHPFEMTTDIGLNTTAERAPAVAVKDLHFKLPPGLVGNPTPFPQCPIGKFTGNAENGQNFCPDDTAIGVASVTVVEVISGGGSLVQTTFAVPLFALVPSIGEPARFGFMVLNVPVYLDTSIRTGGDYGVTVDVD